MSPNIRLVCLPNAYHLIISAVLDIQVTQAVSLRYLVEWARLSRKLTACVTWLSGLDRAQANSLRYRSGDPFRDSKADRCSR